MNTIQTLAAGILLSLACATVTLSQTEQESRRPTLPDPVVTITISAKGIRLTAPGNLGQMRLEVFAPGGESIYNSDFQPGNIRDWALRDKQGQPLNDGMYLCVVTLRSLSGRLSTKQGNIQVQSGRPSLQLSEVDQVGTIEPEKALATVSGNATAVTLATHNGEEGQVVSTRGPLTLRLGNLFAGLDQERMRITPEGNVGIGTDKPQFRLDVAGRIRATEGIEFADGTVLTSGAITLITRKDMSNTVGTAAVGGGGTQNHLPKWSDSGGTLGDSLLAETNGSIELRSSSVGGGISPTITNPNNVPGFALLSFYPVSGPDTNMSFTVVPRGAGATNNRAQFSIFGTDLIADSSNYEFASIRARGTDFVLGTGKAGSGVTRPIMLAAGFLGDNTTNNGQLYLATNGNVGVGTTSPQSKLSVVGDTQITGNVSVSGNIAAKYQDVAEWVRARQDMVAGTVVILDPTQTDAVIPSHSAYDTHVAGVVSAQPGVVLGQSGAGKVLVATTGRVKVKVDARRYAIRIGDLLVTSGKTGAAMRSRPLRAGGVLIHRPGTIIGKALEPLARGEGEVMVLLSLQ